MLEVLEIRSRGAACLHFLKIKTLPSIFYRKRIRNKVMSHSGKMKGGGEMFFLMALAIVKELAYY